MMNTITLRSKVNLIRACQNDDNTEISRIRRRYESKRLKSFKTLFANFKEFGTHEQKLVKSLVQDIKQQSNDFWENLGKTDEDDENEIIEPEIIPKK